MNPQQFPPAAIHSGDLILVNSRLPYVAGATPARRSALGGSSVQMDCRAAEPLSRLMERIGGWQSITPVSGWRSQAEQQQIWDDSLRENGLDFTRQFVAVPGHSEHQTGLAIDLGLTKPDIDFICPDFPDTGVCGQFRALAASYGFVERYPAGKEAITGISPEPWHFRFVGVPHAELMTAMGLTLEEYHDMLKRDFSRERPLCWHGQQADYTVFPLSAAEAESVSHDLDGNAHCTVSGDNDAGFIITLWKERQA